MKNEELDKTGIIKNIKNASISETWTIIGEKKKWVRICPKCNGLVYHKNKKNRNQSQNKNIICRKCKDDSQLKGEYRSCLNCNELFYASIGQSKIGWARFCSVKCNNKYRKVGEYIRTNQILLKQSLSGRKRRYREIIEKFGQIHPNFNVNACNFIESWGKENGYTFQHALNGGEYYIKDLGYWVDGYDEKKNVVIEYNEPHHYKLDGQLNKKDKNRVNEIKSHLQCKFFVYNSLNKKIETL